MNISAEAKITFRSISLLHSPYFVSFVLLLLHFRYAASLYFAVLLQQVLIAELRRCFQSR